MVGLEGRSVLGDQEGKRQGDIDAVFQWPPLSISGTKENWLGHRPGARRLYLATPQFLLYGTGGFAVAGVEADVTPPGIATLTETQNRWGWTAGAGGEYAFSGNWSVKVEYLFVQLQNASYFAAPIVTPAGTVATRGNVPLNNNIVRAGLNYKF